MHKFVVLLCLFAFTVLHNVIAIPHVSYNYASRYFSTRDGLVQMQVACIYQDRDGYMWFGTKYGASRYDGVSFKNYTAKNGLPVGEIDYINGWDDKIVMIAKNKLVILYPNDSIESYTLPDTGGALGVNYPALRTLDKNNLFIANSTKGRVELNNIKHYIFNLKDKKFRIDNFTRKAVTYFDDNYLITLDWIYRIGKNWVLKPVCKIPFHYASLDADMKRGILYFKGVDINTYNSTERNIVKYAFKNNKLVDKQVIMHTVQMTYNSTRLLPDGTLVYFDQNWKSHFYPVRNTDFGVDLTIVNDVFVDRENNLWIATDCGVYNFYNLNIEEYRLNLAKSDNIWSIIEDNEQNMWFGSYGSGLWRLDNELRLREMKQPFVGWKEQYMNSRKNKAGTLFFPSGCGLVKFEHGKFAYSGNTLACTSTYYDEENNNILYSGFDLSKEEQGIYSGFGENKHFFPVKRGLPRVIFKDSRGHILLGSAGGTSYFTGESIVEDTTKHDYKGIICMTEDSKKRLWKGTEKGVFVECGNGKEICLSPGLIDCPIYSIMVYHNKYLLAGGIRGLFVMDIQNITNYNNFPMWEISYDSGFTGLESGQNGFCEDHNGDVWLTTATCVLKFNPEKLVQSQKQIIPPIRIASIHYSADNKSWREIIVDKEINLSSNYKFIRIDYVANSISASRSLRFRYRLNGLSDQWSAPVLAKSVSYTNLPYGNYHFEVECSLDGKKWSVLATTPVIRLLAPFWLRWYMVIMYILLFISSVILITISIRKKKERKRLDIISRSKLENELQLNTLRSKVIPHFTKNVLSAIGQFAMTDKLKASHYIAVFSRFTQLTLSNADCNYISLRDEVEYIETYLELEKMRFGDRFHYHISIDENVDPSTLIPTMTLHTYCDNAIRHGLVHKAGDGELDITVLRQPDGIIIKVRDNGIGRLRAAELGTHGNRQGLNLVQAQVAFYNQNNKRHIVQEITDMVDVNGSQAGTQAVLFVPDDYQFG